MSEIFGTYSYASDAVDDVAFNQLCLSMDHDGHDGVQTLIDDWIGLGFSMLATTTDGEYEVIPKAYTALSLVVVADIRIDNRDELSSFLGMCNEERQGCSDVDLLVFTYKKIGVACFKKILGDFSVVIWDKQKDELVCARDIVGVKPFYYLTENKRFYFASDLKSLVSASKFPLVANEEKVFQYLCNKHYNQSDTLFKDVHILPAAHYLIVKKSGLFLSKYWEPSYKIFRKYKNENDYIDEFKEILRASVKSRMRSQLPISVELSGGVDSSVITSEIVEILGDPRTNELNVLSCIFPGMVCDEEKYIIEVEKHLGVQSNRLKIYEVDILSGNEQGRGSEKLMPLPPNFLIATSVYTKMKELGSRVLLTGIGGDEWFTGTGYPYMDLLRQMKIKNILETIDFRVRYGKLILSKQIIQNLLLPFVPECCRKILCTLHARKNYPPPWLGANLHEYLNNYKTHHIDVCTKIRHVPYSPFIRYLYSSASSSFLETAANLRSKYSVEARHPFLDRRMLEFAISIPENMRFNLGLTKIVIRNAFEERLPRSIIFRKGKAEFSQLFYNHFKYNIKELCFPELLVERGWVRKSEWNANLEKSMEFFKFNQDRVYPQLWQTWNVYMLNRWARCLHGM